ncbi:MAG TPA: D-aminoacyl-tRNA deacylase [Pirellulales bacterium]|nr:D-aminoacyl-tRNA deacylase [Pirellulales bacterium]
MQACIQRVSRAQVTVAGECVGRIERGLVVLLGIGGDDTEAEARLLADKIGTLRVFDDAAGKMNLALADVGGSLLVVSQFTLLGDCRKGRRPSFIAAAPPERAEPLYEHFVRLLREQGHPVETGRFRTSMQLELVNDGPVTLIVDSQSLR